jgi:hypothetical protein
MRKRTPALSNLERKPEDVTVSEERSVIVMRRRAESDEVVAAFHFGGEEAAVSVEAAPGLWSKTLDSAARRWMGPGSSVPEDFRSEGAVALRMSPHSFCVLRRTSPIQPAADGS